MNVDPRMNVDPPAVSAQDFIAEPAPKMARDLRVVLNTALVQDLDRFCGVAAKALPQAAGLARLAVARIDPAEHVNPFLFAIHQDLRAALVAQDTTVAADQLDHLSALVGAGEQHRSGRVIRNRADSGVDRAISSVIFVSDEERELLDSPPMPLDPPTFRRFAGHAAQAFLLLAETDPELSGEADELLNELVLVRGGPEDMTSLKFFGAALIRYPNTFDPATATVYLAETIAHEVSHLMLYAMMNVDPMLHNAELGRYSSPLREDPRPLYGIYHATFVLARLARLYGRLARGFGDGEGDAARRESALAACEEQRRLFVDGYSTLIEYGELTDVGRRILDECRAMAEQAV